MYLQLTFKILNCVKYNKCCILEIYFIQTIVKNDYYIFNMYEMSYSMLDIFNNMTISISLWSL